MSRNTLGIWSNSCSSVVPLTKGDEPEGFMKIVAESEPVKTSPGQSDPVKDPAFRAGLGGFSIHSVSSVASC
jgi:hypothetical protein